jgi:FixJ family two-component response regulator
MSPSIGTVFLVDDEPSVITALTRLLRTADFEVVGFSSAEMFLKAHDATTPGCVVVDVAMPGLSGTELHRKLVKSGCARPVIFLTGRGDIPMGVQAMKDGAVDFLTKPVREEELLAAVRLAIEKDRADRLVGAELVSIEGRLATLTRREDEILRFVIAGLLNKQIAAELAIAEKTIKVHRARIMHKMHARSLAELIRVCIRAGIPPARSAKWGFQGFLTRRPL